MTSWLRERRILRKERRRLWKAIARLMVRRRKLERANRKLDRMDEGDFVVYYGGTYFRRISKRRRKDER